MVTDAVEWTSCGNVPTHCCLRMKCKTFFLEATAGAVKVTAIQVFEMMLLYAREYYLKPYLNAGIYNLR